eukprot:11211181-Lingulodinium_polyedra.AAC.1
MEGACEACDLRAAQAADGNCNRIAVWHCKTLYNDAIEIAARRRSNSQNARFAHSMRTQVFGVRMERAKRAMREPLRRRCL